MDRIIEYPLEQIVVDDFLNQRVADMIALGKLISALLGTQTAVEGLACTPTSPASMDVLVAPGQIFFLEAVDTTTYGDLSPTDNVFGHNVAANAATVMKQGLILSETTFALSAPTTSGDSINYLISAAYQDQDTQDVVLNYFNSSNPSQPFQGPNNSGTAQPTLRQGKCVLTLTAGTAAATGTQQTPAVPSGNVGLYVITVAYGQTSITSTSISVYAGAPFLSQKLFGLMNGSGTVDVPALTASGPIMANGGIDVAGGAITAGGGLTIPSGETATIDGTITIPNATANNEPTALGQLAVPALLATTNIFVYAGANQSVPATTQTTIQFNTIVADNLGEWSTTNSIFTPQASGYYQFLGGFQTPGGSSLTGGQVFESTTRTRLGLQPTSGISYQWTIIGVIKCTAGTAYSVVLSDQNACTIDAGESLTYLSIRRLF